jgi:hypothetical protein
MTVVADITWADLLAGAPAGSVLVDATTNTVHINVATFTGIAIPTLASNGVLPFLYQLLSILPAVEATVNNVAGVTAPLTSFKTGTFSAISPTTGMTRVSFLTEFQLPVNNVGAVGTNN